MLKSFILKMRCKTSLTLSCDTSRCIGGLSSWVFRVVGNENSKFNIFRNIWGRGLKPKIWPKCQMSCWLGLKKLSNWCANFFNGREVSGSWKVERSIKYMIGMMGWLIHYIYNITSISVVDSRIIRIHCSEMRQILSKWMFLSKKKMVRFPFDFLKIYFRV